MAPIPRVLPDQDELHTFILWLLTVAPQTRTFSQARRPDPEGNQQCYICFEDLTVGMHLLFHSNARASRDRPGGQTARNDRPCQHYFCADCVLRSMSEKIAREVIAHDPVTGAVTGIQFVDLKCPYCSGFCVRGAEYGSVPMMMNTFDKLQLFRRLDNRVDNANNRHLRPRARPSVLTVIPLQGPLPNGQVVRPVRVVGSESNHPATVFRRRFATEIESTIPDDLQCSKGQQGNIVLVRRTLRDIIRFWSNGSYPVQNADIYQGLLGSRNACEYWFREYPPFVILEFALRGHDVGIVSADVVNGLPLSLSARAIFDSYYIDSVFSSFPYFAYVQRGSVEIAGEAGMISERLTHIELVRLTSFECSQLRQLLRGHFCEPFEGFVFIRRSDDAAEDPFWDFCT